MSSINLEKKERLPLPPSNYIQKIKRLKAGKKVNIKLLLKRHTLSSDQILGFLEIQQQAFIEEFAAYAKTDSYDGRVALKFYLAGTLQDLSPYNTWEYIFKNFQLLPTHHKLEQLQKMLAAAKAHIKNKYSYTADKAKARLTVITYWYPDLLNQGMIEEYLELGLAIGNPLNYSGETLKSYIKNLKNFRVSYDISEETLKSFAESLANQGTDFIEGCLEEGAIPSDILKFRRTLSPKEISLLLKSTWWEERRTFEGTVCNSMYYSPLDRLLEQPLEKEQFNEILCSYIMEKKEESRIQLSAHSTVQVLYHLDRTNLTKLLTHKDPSLRKAAKFFYEKCPEKEDLAKLLEGGS